MNTRECALICSDATVSEILSLASNLKLKFLKDWPYRSPTPELLDHVNSPSDLEGDVTLFLKPEWIIGPLVFTKIENGYRAGTWALQPRVNFACIEFNLSSGKHKTSEHRLSSCTIVLRSKPIDSITYGEMPEIDDCRRTFLVLVKKLKKNFGILKLSGEKFLVSSRDLKMLHEKKVLPPFPYMDQYLANLP